jgi:hypothetical protein
LLRLKPAPVTVALDTVTGASPEAVNITDSVFVLPTSTPAKFKLLTLLVNWPGGTPVPLSDTDRELFDALLVIDTVPLRAVLAEGVKVKLNVTLPPAATVAGNVGEATTNSAALEVALDIVTEVPPVLLAVIVSVAVLAMATSPKLIAVLLRTKLPGPAGEVGLDELPELNIWQPTQLISATAATAAITNMSLRRLCGLVIFASGCRNTLGEDYG